MAIAPVFYNGMISATPEISNIKISDDSRAATIQANSEAEVAEEAREHVNQVRTKDNADGAESEADASGGSRNQYAGDGGAKRRKKDSFGKVVKKQQGGFSISI